MKGEPRGEGPPKEAAGRKPVIPSAIPPDSGERAQSQDARLRMHSAPMPTVRPRSPSHAGFTLLELLIVLAILVMVLRFPGIVGDFWPERIAQHAKQVRATLAKARLEHGVGRGAAIPLSAGTRRFEITALAATAEEPPARRDARRATMPPSGRAETLLASGAALGGAGHHRSPAPNGPPAESPSRTVRADPVLPQRTHLERPAAIGGRRGFRVPLTLRGGHRDRRHRRPPARGGTTMRPGDGNGVPTLARRASFDVAQFAEIIRRRRNTTKPRVAGASRAPWVRDAPRTTAPEKGATTGATLSG